VNIAPATRCGHTSRGGTRPSGGSASTRAAFKHLGERIALVLVGPGKQSYLDSLADLARREGVGGRLFIHPPVDNEELFRLTCSADVGLVIYHSDSRNTLYCAPNKLYEYASAGLPIVGADLPPVRDFVESYGTGQVFDPGDEMSLARVVTAIFASSDAYEKCRANGLAAAKVLCWENESKALLGLYERVLGAGASERGDSRA
jgi:glycosyltransferase involved in cell wall biosynthesis